MDQFSVQLLGGFAVRRGDHPVDLPPACQRLVALVALKRKPVHRLWVCATLWPRAETRRAVASLRSTLWRLRPVGAEPTVIVDPQYLQLAPEVSVDWHESTELIGQLLRGDIDSRLVADLLPLLRAGELLDKWAEKWVAAERDRYHEARLTAIETLAHTAEKPIPHYLLGSAHTTHLRRTARAGTRNTGEWRQP